MRKGVWPRHQATPGEMNYQQCLLINEPGLFTLYSSILFLSFFLFCLICPGNIKAIYDYCRRQSASSINDVAPAWMSNSFDSCPEEFEPLECCGARNCKCNITKGRGFLLLFIRRTRALDFLIFIRYSHWPLFLPLFFFIGTTPTIHQTRR